MICKGIYVKLCAVRAVLHIFCRILVQVYNV